MKRLAIYQCEYCDFTGTKDQCEEHEAKHLGMSVSEYRHYKKLKEEVNDASYTVNRRKNAKTEAAYDRAIKNLLEFEQMHGLI